MARLGGSRPMPRLPSVRSLAQKIIDEIPVIYLEDYPICPLRAGIHRGKFWWLEGSDRMHAPSLRKAVVVKDGKALFLEKNGMQPDIYICALEDSHDLDRTIGRRNWEAGRVWLEEPQHARWLAWALGTIPPIPR